MLRWRIFGPFFQGPRYRRLPRPIAWMLGVVMIVFAMAGRFGGDQDVATEIVRRAVILMSPPQPAPFPSSPWTLPVGQLDKRARGTAGVVDLESAGAIEIETDARAGEIAGIQVGVCGFGTACELDAVAAHGGDIRIDADRMRLSGVDRISNTSFEGGDAGNIAITLHSGLEIVGAGAIQGITLAEFDSGDITIDVSQGDVPRCGAPRRGFT